MTEIMPVPRNSILLSYQQGAYAVSVLLSAQLYWRMTAVTLPSSVASRPLMGW